MANIETSQEGVPEFGRRHRLALALEYAELSHQDAADRLGVSRQTIANWVSGRTFPKDFALKAVALMCGVDPQWLLTGNPAKSPSDTHNRAGKPMCAPSDSNREPAGNDIIILHALQDAA